MALTKADQTAIATMIAAALAGMQASDVEDDSTNEPTPAKSRTKKTPNGVGRESRFTPSAVKRLSIPRRKGAAFQYAGKRGTTHWKVAEVNDDGSVQALRTK